VTARLYIRPLARIAPPARDRSPRLLPALAVAGRGDLLFAAAELIEREGGRVVRRSYMAADILAGGPSEAAGLPSLLDNLRRPRAPIAGLALDRPRTMGIVNVTPDSFADGGRYHARDAAIAHALQLEAEGADILDIGGESTRPGADPISAEEELARVLPVLEGLRGKLRIPISLDTQKADVAEAGIAAGVEMVNDVSALRTEPQLAEVVRRRHVALVLMHMRGKPRSMQRGPFASNVLRDVCAGLRVALGRAMRAGIAKSRLLVDPGIGFGKKYAQNLELLRHLPELARLGYPLVIGTSRKGFIGWALAGKGEPWPTEKRRWGTAATVTGAILGGAHIVRVHDVVEMAEVARIADAIARTR